MKKKFDYIILGGGVAGIYLAKTLARKNKILLIEKEKLGGTSLRVGAVPIKRLLDIFKENGDKLLIRKYIIQSWKFDIERLESIILTKLDSKNIEVVHGEANFIDENRISIFDDIYESDKIIVATGTSPVGIDNIKLDNKYVLSHKDLIENIIFDKKIIVYGGNVEGMEIANFLQLLGNEVIIVECENQILHEKDEDLIFPIRDHFEEIGGKIILGQKVENVAIVNNQLYTRLSNQKEIISDLGVLTFNRRGNIPNNLESIGVEVVDGFIKVDKNFKTNKDSIYAIGDINKIHAMAHIAIDQARILANNLLFEKKEEYNYEVFPGAFFTIPEYVGVGVCEKDLEKGEYKVGIAQLNTSFRGWAKSYKEGFVKVLIDKDDKLIGMHIIGENVSEYLGFLTAFVGKDYRKLLNTLVVHPSFSESIKEAIENGIYGE